MVEKMISQSTNFWLDTYFEQVSSGKNFALGEEVHTEEKLSPEEATAYSRGDHSEFLVGKREYVDGDVFYKINYYGSGMANLFVRGETWESASDTLNWLKEQHPKVEPQDDNTVEYVFHYRASDHLAAYYRNIHATSFNQIKNNYTSSVQTALGELVGTDLEEVNGNLLLWHGLPGTGKTWMIRALSKEWGHQADFHYVLDPETFFGGSPEYIMNVLEDEGDNDWKVIVLEDTGEMWPSNAKANVGQGLSRLLNLADGIIGQGMKCIFLLTTNEEIGSLHPALTRPGRCLSDISFKELTKKEANDWLEQHGSKERVTKPTRLSDLYSLISDSPTQVSVEKDVVGGMEVG